jgi:hypothetical protein
MCSKHAFIKFSKDKKPFDKEKETRSTSHRSRPGLPQEGCKQMSWNSLA